MPENCRPNSPRSGMCPCAAFSLTVSCRAEPKFAPNPLLRVTLYLSFLADLKLVEIPIGLLSTRKITYFYYYVPKITTFF